MPRPFALAPAILAVGSVSIAASLMLPAGTRAPDASRLASKVVRWDEVPAERGPWGEIRRYFSGEGFGAKDLLAAIAVVKPGEALHEAHRHAEEEFLLITEGSGTWHLSGKEFPLKKGDVLYVEPWAMHGCRNTGKEPLTFFVARWSGKGIPAPPEPKEKD